MYCLMVLLVFGGVIVSYASVCQDKSSYCYRLTPSIYCSERSNKYWAMMKYCPKHCSICTNQCGMSQAASGRVIGGTDATAAAWPWNVAIFYKNKFVCGGVLIHSEFVLTSAACVKNVSPQDIFVSLGETDLTKPENEHRIRAYKIIIHPQNVGGKNYDHNIALIELHFHAIYKDTVQPACLPTLNPADGTVCYLTGWGKRQAVGGKHGNAYAILQKVSLRITSNSACQIKNSMGHPISNGMLCAEPTNKSQKQGACLGDFGSPLVCQQSNGSWMLHGIVNWIHAKCDTNVYDTVFTRVSSYRQWIDKTISV